MTASWHVSASSAKAVFSPEEAACELGLTGPHCLDSSKTIQRASLDTRSLQPGSLFAALKGANQDGHAFLEEAFRRGASAALISRDYFQTHRERLSASGAPYRNLLPVPDPEAALALLAAWRRRLYTGPVLGVTGSVGKTSTKEMLGYLLSQRRPGLTSSGNFNNQLGLPLNLIALDSSHAFCLAELGASKPGDIRFLTSILKPTHALLTQVSPSHLEGFGSLEAIYRTKLELPEALNAGGTAVLPDFDPHLKELAAQWPRRWVFVGETPEADYRMTAIRMEEGHVVFTLAGRQTYRVPAPAAFFAQNAAMACALADLLGFALEDQPAVWEDFRLPAGRFEVRKAGDGLTVVFDGYNASPGSFKRSIEGFQTLPAAGRKAVIFSDMLELGPEEDKFHRELGERLGRAGFDLIGAYGRLSRAALEAARGTHASADVRAFDSPEEAGRFLAGYLKKGDAVLLKASRGMRIEKVFTQLEACLSEKMRAECR